VHDAKIQGDVMLSRGCVKERLDGEEGSQSDR
jgi:hypothetical protein